LEIKVSVRSDGIASTTVEGSMSAGVSKALVASSAVEVSPVSDTAGVPGGSVAGGEDSVAGGEDSVAGGEDSVAGSGDSAAGTELDFQKKLLVPREPLKARL
jgi:hypothetical protein